MRRNIKKIFILILLLILLFVMYSKYIKKDKITKILGYSFFIVLTGSMEPNIETGSLIIIKEVNNYKIRRCYYLFRG